MDASIFTYSHTVRLTTPKFSRVGREFCPGYGYINKIDFFQLFFSIVSLTGVPLESFDTTLKIVRILSTGFLGTDSDTLVIPRIGCRFLQV